MATIKQKKAFKALGENGGVISKAMLTAGYSPKIVHATEKLTNSDGWQELMQKHLDDKTLAKVHAEGLKATTKKPHLIDRDDKGRPIYDYVKEDDYAVRHKYLDLAYKVKGKTQDVIPQNNQTVIVNNFFSNPKILEATKAYDEQLKQAMINEIQEPDKTL